jgi:hypothetical protein
MSYENCLELHHTSNSNVFSSSQSLQLAARCLFLHDNLVNNIFFLWHYNPLWALSSSVLRFLNHTQTHGRTPLHEWSAHRRGLYLHRTTQNINTRDIHALSGIRTRDSSNQAARDLHLTPRGHRDRLLNDITRIKEQGNVPVLEQGCSEKELCWSKYKENTYILLVMLVCTTPVSEKLPIATAKTIFHENNSFAALWHILVMYGSASV